MAATKTKTSKFNRELFYKNNPHLRPKKAQIVVIVYPKKTTHLADARDGL